MLNFDTLGLGTHLFTLIFTAAPSAHAITIKDVAKGEAQGPAPQSNVVLHCLGLMNKFQIFRLNFSGDISMSKMRYFNNKFSKSVWGSPLPASV